MHAVTWRKLNVERENARYCMIPFIRQSGKGKFIGAENRSVVGRGQGGRRDKH